MLPSTHNIRGPAFLLVLSCLAAIAFFILTDPRWSRVRYGTDNAVDAVHRAEIGTYVGVGGAGLILLIALFLCTRKGAPRTH